MLGDVKIIGKSHAVSSLYLENFVFTVDIEGGPLFTTGIRVALVKKVEWPLWVTLSWLPERNFSKALSHPEARGCYLHGDEADKLPENRTVLLLLECRHGL